ncbi:MAG: hypothetical protein IJO14_11585 [Clostridia bacterium]|nr:hypothetical protein [Clostridia bacterium]
MKRFLISFLCCILVCLQVLPCFASADNTKTEINEDGSFFVIRDTPLDPADLPPGFEGSLPPGSSEINGNTNALIRFFKIIIEKLMQLIRQLQGKEEVTKSKYIYYYSSDSKLLWCAKLTGRFLLSSDSAECIDVAFDFESYDSNWSISDYNCKKDAATAQVTFYVVQKSLGVKLQTIEKTLQLTCDKNGNVT